MTFKFDGKVVTRFETLTSLLKRDLNLKARWNQFDHEMILGSWFADQEVCGKLILVFEMSFILFDRKLTTGTEGLYTLLRSHPIFKWVWVLT